jgi:hypothetical protein
MSGYGKRSTFEKHIFLSQIDLTRTGIISNSYNEMFEARNSKCSEREKHGFLFYGNYILKYW